MLSNSNSLSHTPQAALNVVMVVFYPSLDTPELPALDNCWLYLEKNYHVHRIVLLYHLLLSLRAETPTVPSTFLLAT